MKTCAVLFSGGKDSCYAAYLAAKKGYKISCLITLVSKNKKSYMFHTSTIGETRSQSKSLNMPLLVKKTKGQKEIELGDLEKAIKRAKSKYKFDVLVSGIVQSDYQKIRTEKICKKLGLEFFMPLWQKKEFTNLDELLKNKFQVIVTEVSTYPFDKSWIGRVLDRKFIHDLKSMQKKYKINLLDEGRAFETFVLDCPLFKKPLKIKSKKISGKDHSWRMEIKL